MPKKTPTRQLITSVYEPPAMLETAALRKISGTLTTITPNKPAILTVLDEPDVVVDLPLKGKRKAVACCDQVNANPICAIVSTSLSRNFANLEVEVVAAHACGIRSIAGHIRTVTYTQVGPGAIRRALNLFRLNGNPVVAGRQFPCPSNRQIRAHTLSFPTRGLIGVRFLARIKVASCCDNAPRDTSVCWVNSSEKFII